MTVASARSSNMDVSVHSQQYIAEKEECYQIIAMKVRLLSRLDVPLVVSRMLRLLSG